MALTKVEYKESIPTSSLWAEVTSYKGMEQLSGKLSKRIYNKPVLLEIHVYLAKKRNNFCGTKTDIKMGMEARKEGLFSKKRCKKIIDCSAKMISNALKWKPQPEM
ncbi:hypothetical protein XENOCAPTIV_005499 [Xenoophorus captivus]|uniref:Uncharacterized protein n=1 Tax=Xenoophorus captivus TaxID=1517983 RepID=A0ABV0SDG8_9TELE